MDLAPKKPLIGLDIGTHAVKAVLLQHDSGGYAVNALGYAPIKAPSPEAETALESIVDPIREVLEKIQLESIEHWVVCSLNGEQVLVRPFELAPLNPSEIPQAIRLEAMQVSPFGLDNATVDHQVLEITGNAKSESVKERPIKGVLAVGTHKAIDSKRDLARQAGARCVLMDIDGLALLNAAMQLPAIDNAKTDANEAVIVINIGHNYTTVAIGASGVAPFIRDIPFAGKAVLSMLCEQMHWSPEQASAALQQGHMHDADPGHIDSVLDQAGNQLAESIGETLRYYAAQQIGRAFQQVRVCGGAARMQGLISRLNQRLSSYPFKLWNPLDSLTYPAEIQQNLDLATQGPSFAVALGLALRKL